jgi:hypothetical protein
MDLLHKCSYCGSAFKRANALRKHQRQAQYCLRKQEAARTKSTPIRVTRPPAVVKYACKYCRKEFSRKFSAQRHEKTCPNNPFAEEAEGKPHKKSKKDFDGNTMLEVLINLQQQVLNMQPGTNNRNNLSLEPVTEESLKEHLDRLSIAYINEGAKGYADYANYHSLRNKLVCTDKARKNFRFKQGDGRIVNDGGGVKITQRFFQSIAERNEDN